MPVSRGVCGFQCVCLGTQTCKNVIAHIEAVTIIDPECRIIGKIRRAAASVHEIVVIHIDV